MGVKHSCHQRMKRPCDHDHKAVQEENTRPGQYAISRRGVQPFGPRPRALARWRSASYDHSIVGCMSFRPLAARIMSSSSSRVMRPVCTGKQQPSAGGLPHRAGGQGRLESCSTYVAAGSAPPASAIRRAMARTRADFTWSDRISSAAACWAGTPWATPAARMFRSPPGTNSNTTPDCRADRWQVKPHFEKAWRSSPKSSA